MNTYLSPRERQAVIDAAKVLHGSIPDGSDRELLASASEKLPALFEDYDATKNIATMAHNAVVWFTGNKARMFHKLGDIAEALCERDGVKPDEHGASQLQIEAVRIRRTWGHHVNE